MPRHSLFHTTSMARPLCCNVAYLFVFLSLVNSACLNTTLLWLCVRQSDSVNTEKSRNQPSSVERSGFSRLLFIDPSIHISVTDSENTSKNLILHGDETFPQQTLTYET